MPLGTGLRRWWLEIVAARPHAVHGQRGGGRGVCQTRPQQRALGDRLPQCRPSDGGLPCGRGRRRVFDPLACPASAIHIPHITPGPQSHDGGSTHDEFSIHAALLCTLPGDLWARCSQVTGLTEFGRGPVHRSQEEHSSEELDSAWPPHGSGSGTIPCASVRQRRLHQGDTAHLAHDLDLGVDLCGCIVGERDRLREAGALEGCHEDHGSEDLGLLDFVDGFGSDPDDRAYFSDYIHPHSKQRHQAQ
mmetsp:Transcript_62190/g.157450  ORF Transcript_62190/g.157450 Transcript_62190/m.157450 type:complete len:247 (+) Transcript_62190:106-846(+)